MFWLNDKIEKNNNLYKKAKNNLEIKTIGLKLKNIIPSIWIKDEI
jgi:hypothetical protein